MNILQLIMYLLYKKNKMYGKKFNYIGGDREIIQHFAI